VVPCASSPFEARITTSPFLFSNFLPKTDRSDIYVNITLIRQIRQVCQREIKATNSDNLISHRQKTPRMLIFPQYQERREYEQVSSEEKAMEPKEVAELLNVSVRSVIRLAERGEMVAFKVGGLWRFHRSDVDDYITRQKQKQQQSKRDEGEE
jgi:excisionase family DNA binding protein